ncbi:MAG: AAA family ATPase [Magnetococcales bacterium]|nr:AAA family ATPase [Magnetococcales bacterium]
MLESFTLENFRSHEKSTLPLAPLTMLIGANASGKSNVIEGLRLLSALAQGHPLSTLRPEEHFLRGRFRDMTRKEGGQSFTISCDFGLPRSYTLSFTVSIGSDNAPRIINESLLDNTRDSSCCIYATTNDGEFISGQHLLEHKDKDNYRIKINIFRNDVAFFSSTESINFPVSEHENWNNRDNRVVDLVFFRHTLSSMVFLDPVPAVMRGYGFIGGENQDHDGRNVSGVLFNLWGGNKNEGLTEAESANRAHILEFIRSLPEQDIEGLSFITTERDEVMVKVRETFGGKTQEFDASLLSDGTLRVLAIAAAMLSVPEGGMVVIEEIDNGIHPSRVKAFLQKIASLAESRNLRVLLTSHNPALLDALPLSAIPDVVFCYRDPTSGYSRLVRLQDVPDYPELMAQGGVGQLMTRGTLEDFVKYHPDPETKKERARKWLQELRERTARLREEVMQEQGSNPDGMTG